LAERGRFAATITDSYRSRVNLAHLLCLGDSYTIGESVMPEARWPVLLAARLRVSGLDVADPDLVARTGWTTDELEEGIESAEPSANYDLVTLLIGVNDQYRGRGENEYRERFRKLLNRAKTLAGCRESRVLVVSIPDWGVTPFASGRDRAAIASAIDTFNRVARDETRRGHAHWVDVTPISRQAATDSTLIAGDGLHPSEAMYRRWVEVILPVARSALGWN